MEPDKFRESRQAINRLCEDIDLLIEQKALDASKERYEEVNESLNILRPQAEGEIQKRSVKNLGSKLKGLSKRISKLKPGKASPRKGKQSRINWDNQQVEKLSKAFLEKVLINMGDDRAAAVCFGTSGKGIRPNYQISFDSDITLAYNGSSHKSNPKLISQNSTKLSQPFSREIIESSFAKE